MKTWLEFIKVHTGILFLCALANTGYRTLSRNRMDDDFPSATEKTFVLESLLSQMMNVLVIGTAH